METQRGSETEIHRDRGTQTDTETVRQTERDTESDIDRESQTETETDKQRQSNRDTERDTHTNRDRDTKTEIHSHNHHMARRCKSSVIFGPDPGTGPSTEKCNYRHIIKHVKMKFCKYNQHWGH